MIACKKGQKITASGLPGYLRIFAFVCQPNLSKLKVTPSFASLSKSLTTRPQLLHNDAPSKRLLATIDVRQLNVPAKKADF